jgi:hypothetical protein
MPTTKQFVVRVKYSNYGVSIRSYEVTEDDRLRATKSNEDFHIRDSHSYLSRDHIDEIVEDHLAEARYLGYDASRENVNAELYELD